MRRRLPVLLGFTLAGAVLTPAVGLLRGFGIPVALPLGAFGLFALSFIRIYGQSAGLAGGILSFALILALDRPLPGLADAAVIAATFLAGGAWATLLTLVLWRLHPFLPARRAVAEVYRRLAMLTADLYGALSTGANAARWEAHAREHRRAVREAIEAARAIVLDTVRGRGAGTPRGANSLIRLEAADQIFGALIALSELAEQGTVIEHRAALRILRRLRPVQLLLGQATLADHGAPDTRVGRSIDAIAAGIAALPAADPLAPPATRIVERLRVAHTLALPQNFLPGTDAAGRGAPWRQRLLSPVRANLTWRSPALRHATRIAVMGTPALAFTMLHFDPFDHWLTISIVATMQPYFAITWTGAVQRIAGTALGGLAAAAIGLVCTSPLAIAAAMFPLAVASFAVRAVSLGLFTATLTPLVVLLVESIVPGTSEWSIAWARFVLTATGGVIAVAAGFLLWPTWEPGRLGQEARAAIGAHGAYAAAVLSAAIGDALHPAVETARRAAGLATNNLEASISRALTEPGSTGRDRLEAALVVDAALRRMAGRLSAIQLDAGVRAALSAGELAAWRAWIVGTLSALAAGDTALPARPVAPYVDALARLARQAELIAGVIARLAG